MELTIVALPSVDDNVWKVSSEKVPHLTLLYLHDAVKEEDTSSILEYVAHAAGELSPFGLSVDYRGPLGDDDADVLFFEDDRWDLRRIKEFRHYLLLNDTIKRAYDSTEQYPEWTPHLTLGYPETPAKESDAYLGYVQFDRIAVWIDDFAGPEFRLKYSDHGPEEVSMSNMSTVDRGAVAVAELFHYGVKGMKWGVRKDDGGAPKERGKIRRGATKASVSLDAGAKIIREGEKRLIFLPEKNRADAAKRTQYRMLAAAAKVNSDPQFKGKDIKNDAPLKKAYFNRLKEEAKTIYAEELNISRTEAWGEFLNVDTSATTQQMRINAAVDRIRHADEATETLLEMNFITNELGHVTDIEVPEKYLKHFEDNEYTIVHYGVKGMRWGVRKDVASSAGGADKGPTAVVVEQKKPGTYAKTHGGKNIPMHEDARVALEGRQKAKASTTDALSNDELRKVIQRMQLEQQYTQLKFTEDRRSRGLRFAQGLFGKKRYGGEKRRYTDPNEEFGGQIRDVIKSVQEVRKGDAAS